MRDAHAKLGAIDLEAGWPCQRLRLAFGLILFFLFETLVGHRLPQLVPALCLGLGTASLASALAAIRSWRDRARAALVRQALEEHCRRRRG